ncbi:MAG: hypothetical protein WCT20_03470 [Candidatus Babeliales bacterium]
MIDEPIGQIGFEYDSNSSLRRRSNLVSPRPETVTSDLTTILPQNILIGKPASTEAVNVGEIKEPQIAAQPNKGKYSKRKENYQGETKLPMPKPVRIIDIDQLDHLAQHFNLSQDKPKNIVARTENKKSEPLKTKDTNETAQLEKEARQKEAAQLNAVRAAEQAKISLNDYFTQLKIQLAENKQPEAIDNPADDPTIKLANKQRATVNRWLATLPSNIVAIIGYFDTKQFRTANEFKTAIKHVLNDEEVKNDQFAGSPDVKKHSEELFKKVVDLMVKQKLTVDDINKITFSDDKDNYSGLAKDDIPFIKAIAQKFMTLGLHKIIVADNNITLKCRDGSDFDV